LIFEVLNENVPFQSKRKKEEPESDDSDVPLTARKKMKKEKVVVKQEKSKKKVKRSITGEWARFFHFEKRLSNASFFMFQTMKTKMMTMMRHGRRKR
jgi:hypothetical protein